MMSEKHEQSATVTAADIERSIQALNKMAERLWGDGREAEAKALIDALDALNRALDRIRIGEIGRAATLHRCRYWLRAIKAGEKSEALRYR